MKKKKQKKLQEKLKKNPLEIAPIDPCSTSEVSSRGLTEEISETITGKNHENIIIENLTISTSSHFCHSDAEELRLRDTPVQIKALLGPSISISKNFSHIS